MLAAVIAGIIVASFLYGLRETFANQPLAFFSTFSRAWQLLAGALLAVLLASGVVLGRRAVPLVGLAGLALLLWSFGFIDQDKGFPGWVATLPVIGGVAIILAGTAASGPAYAILGIAPLRFIGRVSYVWYLWHWPILFGGDVLFPAAGLATHLALIVLSFLLAVATHFLVENPVRFLPFFATSRLRSLLLGLVLTLTSIAAGWALTAYALDQSVTLRNGASLKLEDITDDRSPAYRSDCHASQLETAHEECIFGAPAANPEAVLFGDSHAAHFFNPVEDVAVEMNTAFLMRSKSGCAAVLGPMWNAKFKRQYIECDEWKKGVLEEIAERKPKLVILSSAVLQQMMPPGVNAPAAEADRPALYRDALRRMVGEILQHAGRVVLITDTPRLPEEPLICLVRHPGKEDDCQWPLSNVTTGMKYVPDLSEFGDRVRVVDLSGGICPGGVCRAVSDGKVVFYDQSHFTATYSANLKGEFRDIFKFGGIGTAN